MEAIKTTEQREDGTSKPKAIQEALSMHDHTKNEDRRREWWLARKEMQRAFDEDDGGRLSLQLNRAWHDRNDTAEERSFTPNISDFLTQFPTPEAFDAYFITDRGRALEAELNSPDARNAEDVRRALEQQERREKEAFPYIRAKLYATDSPYKPLQEPEELALPEDSDPIQGLIRNSLSYQDVALSPDPAKDRELKESTLKWSQNSESAKKYAASLRELAETRTLQLFEVETAARGLQLVMLNEAERLGIPLTQYGKSITWAMWDIGKQFYFTKQEHREEQIASGYGEPANPLESKAKQDEIINRHLGWEAYAAFNANAEWKAQVMQDPRFAPALEFLNKPPKQNNTLSSKDLADLGKALRDVR